MSQSTLPTTQTFEQIFKSVFANPQYFIFSVDLSAESESVLKIEQNFNALMLKK